MQYGQVKGDKIFLGCTRHVRCKQRDACNISGPVGEQALNSSSHKYRRCVLFAAEAFLYKLHSYIHGVKSWGSSASLSRLCKLDHLLVMTLTEGAYSMWLPYASDVTRSWQKCGCRLGPSCDLTLVMHSTTAEDSWGLLEYAVAKRNVFARAKELAVSDAA